MSQTVSVEVGEDHLAAFMRSPRIAIAELVWNALDADATEVDVTYQLNDFGGIEGVVISDNGTGMTPSDASYGFGNFGNSWKRRQPEPPVAVRSTASWDEVGTPPTRSVLMRCGPQWRKMRVPASA